MAGCSVGEPHHSARTHRECKQHGQIGEVEEKSCVEAGLQHKLNHHRDSSGEMEKQMTVKGITPQRKRNPPGFVACFRFT